MNKEKEKFTEYLPTLEDEKNHTKINDLMELFFRQLMTFSFYLDESGKVETYKYASFVLFVMRKKLDKYIEEKNKVD